MLNFSSQSPHSQSRRSFLRSAFCASAALPLTGWSQGSAQASDSSGNSRFATVSIFHTTDLHGNILPTATYEGVSGLGGLARCASAIKRWQKEAPNHLILDIGDLYQGTHVSQTDEGQVMIDLLNRLGYDGWVVGNHEFDWGHDIFLNAVGNSKMPVLSANLTYGDRASTGERVAGDPFSNIAPSILRQVGDLKIGVVGLTTPGLTAWLRPELLLGLGAVDPVEPVKKAVAQLKADGADAIVAAGHMGLKRGRDDYANPVREVLSEVPEIDAFIAGHTHQDEPSYTYRDTRFTQAGYFGIYAGRLELTFDRETKTVIDARGNTHLMDDRYALDPVVISVASSKLEASEEALAMTVGVLDKPLEGTSTPGKPSPAHELIGAAISAALAAKQLPVDGVLHGTFTEDTIPAGEKTLGDIWKIIPYENMLVTAELSGDDVRAIYEEAINVSWSDRQLIGFEARVNGSEHGEYKLDALFDPSGNPVRSDRRYKIAFNSYDSQSGGNRMTLLRDILAKPENKAEMQPIDTRSALVEYFSENKSV